MYQDLSGTLSRIQERPETFFRPRHGELKTKALAVWFKDLDKWAIPQRGIVSENLPDGWRVSRICDVLSQIADVVKVDPDREYKMLAWISTEHNSPNIFDFFRRRESLTGLCRSSVGGVAPATRESPRRGRTGQTPIRSAGVPGDEIPRGLLCR